MTRNYPRPIDGRPVSAAPIIVAGALLFASLRWAGAQGAPPHRPPAPPAVAGIAPAPQAAAAGQPIVPVARTMVDARGVVWTVMTLAPPVATGLLPVVVTADGRIFADFGWGYEPILRACPALTASAATAPAGAPFTFPLFSIADFHVQPGGNPGPAGTAAGARAAPPPPPVRTASAGPSSADAQRAPSPASVACWSSGSGRVLIAPPR